MRFFSPILFFGTAAFVAYHNTHSSGELYVFPFVTTFWPEAAGDPEKLTQGTVGLFAALGAIFLVRDLRRMARARQVEADDA